MSPWNHSICETCWKARNPERTPTRLKVRSWETCCFCGNRHDSGIFVRHDPKTLRCQGKHSSELPSLP